MTSNGRRRAYLHAGQIFASAEPHAVTTILGSCVAVGVWDPRLGTGGLNHFQLPYPVAAATASPRFGVMAMTQLLAKLAALGGDRRNLQAKIFGGACVLAQFAGGDGHLGADNVALARRLLEAAGIPVVAESVGGRQGRKLVFHTDDGTALVRVL
jgi:chemotaxis protein CheD